MNRTIEFRVWDFSAQEYMKQVRVPTYAFNILEAENPELMYESSKNLVSLAWALENTQDFESQQFTGLLDTKGKKIFEGDIVSPIIKSDIFNKEIVSWLAGTTGYYPFASQFVWVAFFNNKEAFQWEVIGNVKENPELFKISVRN